MKQKQQEQQKTNKWSFALYIGLFGGLLWGALKMGQHYLKYTNLSPGFLIEPFFKHSYLSSLSGYLLGWGAFIAFSIVAALIYALLFAKAKGPWVGVGYGIGWWTAIYLLIGPITGMTKWIVFMDWNTIITDLCLFTVWGLFIGYSISFEFTDESVREPFKQTAANKS